VTQERIEFFKRHPLVFIDVKLLEDGLKALLGKEFLLVHSHHHKLLQRNKTVARAVRHLDQPIDAVLVEISSKVLSVAAEELLSRECAIAGRVQISEHLLQLNCVVHVQEVLYEVA